MFIASYPYKVRQAVSKENRPVARWDLPRTSQEAVNQVSNFICCRIQREVTTIDSIHLRLRDIAAERFRFGIIERKFVHAPKNEQAWLGLTHPFLPLWVGSDVGLVIVKQIALDVSLAWLVQETDFIGPQIRIVALDLGIIAYMPRARGGKREQIRAQGHLVGCAVGPKSAAEVPVFPETALMRHSILNDERLNALRVSKSQAKANWPTIVLHVEAVMCQAQRFGHMLHHGRDVVEGVRELGMIRPIAMAETRIIRSDQVIAVGQALQQRLIHPRRGWQAVKQKQGRGVFRPCLPVENGQVVDLHGAIRHCGVHKLLLLLVLSQNPAWSQQYQEKPRDDEKDGCFLVAMKSILLRT